MAEKEARPGDRKKFVIVGLGEVLWDVFSDGRRLGGAPANFGFYANGLGEDGIIVSRVGKDREGVDILARIQSAGLDTRWIEVDHVHPTGSVTVFSDERGLPRFTIHEERAWDFLTMNPGLEALAVRTDAVCYGSLGQRSATSREAILSFLEKTRPDCLRILDLNLRPPFIDPERIDYLLKRSRILKLNEEEIRKAAQYLGMPGGGDDVAAALLANYPLELVVLTRGERGSRVFGRDETVESPAAQVEVVDTVGAGDAFTAVVAVGRLRNKSLELINEVANRVAGFVCSRRGAWAELPESLVESL